MTLLVAHLSGRGQWRHQVDEEERQPAAHEACHYNTEYEERPPLLGPGNASTPVIWIVELSPHRVGHARCIALRAQSYSWVGLGQLWQRECLYIWVTA